MINEAFRESEAKRYVHTIQNSYEGCYSQYSREAQKDLLYAQRRQSEAVLRHSPYCLPLYRSDRKRRNPISFVETTPPYPYTALCERYPAEPKRTNCIIDRAYERLDREDKGTLLYGSETRLKDMLTAGNLWQDKNVRQMNWTAMYGSSNLTWFSHRMKVISQSKESVKINYLTGRPYGY